jgi:large subunit ribosomal protein L18
MKREQKKNLQRLKRRRRIRGRMSGVSERPRLSIFRSHKQIYAQVVDDDRGMTLCSVSTLQLRQKGALGDAKGCNLTGATAAGAELAKRALAAGVTTVAFDRGGYRYHGRVKALADAAREGGLKF